MCVWVSEWVSVGLCGWEASLLYIKTTSISRESFTSIINLLLFLVFLGAAVIELIPYMCHRLRIMFSPIAAAMNMHYSFWQPTDNLVPDLLPQVRLLIGDMCSSTTTTITTIIIIIIIIITTTTTTTTPTTTTTTTTTTLIIIIITTTTTIEYSSIQDCNTLIIVHIEELL